MNYITLINNFWHKTESAPLSANAVCLFFSILNQANKKHWETPLIINNLTLQGSLNISRSTFFRARAELSEKGYIKTEPASRYFGTEYEILVSGKKRLKFDTFFETLPPKAETKTDTQPDTQAEPQADTHEGLSSINTKQKILNQNVKQKPFYKNNDKEIYNSGRYDFEEIERKAREKIIRRLEEDEKNAE